MKMFKTLAIACVLAAVSVAPSAFGQGQLVFQSLVGNQASANGIVRDAANAPLHTSAFVAQLWGGTTDNPGSFTQISGTYNFSAVDSDSTFWGGIFDTSGPGGGSTYTISGAAAGSTYFYQIRAWTIADGATFTIASGKNGAQVGQSASKSIVLGGGQVTPPNTDQFTSFSLTVVPEPSVLALGLLGGAVLLFRRRK